MPTVYSAEDLALLVEGKGPLAALTPPPRLAVIGDPVAHSKSPQMHNAALRARNKDLQYIRLHVTAAELPEALRNLTPAGFLGASLTIPHKQAAMNSIQVWHKTVPLLGAINTVSVSQKGLVGLNTDAIGFIRAVKEEFHLESVRGLNILILGGAGGAGRAISAQCFFEGANPTIVNRAKEKGDALVQALRDYRSEESNNLPGILNSIDMDPERLRDAVAQAALIVNATPLGMKANDPSPLPEGLLTKDHLVYDSVYSGGETALQRQALHAGARYANGLSMLLHQGALQFEHWFGEPAPLNVMRSALEEARKH
jgi:shikimate dehydrogenase